MTEEEWRELMALYVRAIRPFLSREEKQLIAAMIVDVKRASDTETRQQRMEVLIQYFRKEEFI